MTPEQRQMRARMGGLAVQAKHGDAVARRARRGLRAKFEREVDPEGVLSEAERRRRADLAFRRHMAGLALRSSRARREQ